jgi:predicted double-glycine peptidase
MRCWSSFRAVPIAALIALAAAAPSHAQALFDIAGESAAVQVTSLRDMPFRTVVRQQYDYSCGSAALATLLKYHYGRAVDEATIFQAMYAAGDQAKIRKVGFSLLDMKHYLAAQGLPANGFRWSLTDLMASRTPTIALVRVGSYRHFVIVKGARAGKVLVGDPAVGLKLYAADDFRKIWDGIVFRIDDRASRGATYDRPEDWGHFSMGPIDPLSDTALGTFTRELPPVYQIVALPTGGGAVR